MKWNNINKIWKKLALGAIITVLMTLFITNYIEFNINAFSNNKSFESDLESMVNVAAFSLEEPLWNLNNETLVSICDSFFQKESVSQIIVKDSSLGVIYEKKLTTEPHNDNLLTTIKRDITHNNKVIGSLEFSMTKYFINNQNALSTKVDIVEMIILIVLLTTVLTTMISKVTKPLTTLQVAFEQVTEVSSDTMPQVKISTKDEIGELTHSFNIMSKNIFDARNSIKLLNEELENKVETRTGELNIKNKELEESLVITNKTQQELIDTNLSLSNTLRELQNIQELLVESGKMALLGELVAGVAHEINTPIGVSLTASSFIEKEVNFIIKKVEANDLTKSDFVKILTSLQESSSSVVRNLLRAAELINSFKQVAVDQSSHTVRKFNFKKYVNEIVLNLKSQFKNRTITVTNNCADDLNIISYPGAYSQILTNMLMNSLVHAFSDTSIGEIVIDAKKVESNIVIVFKDNGFGIKEENVKKVFNPFFTTKRGFGGSGLGLNLAYNIVTNILKGSIICESILNEGTTFTITVPFEHPDIDPKMF